MKLPPGVVISDIRFRNEILKLRSRGCIIIRLKRSVSNDAGGVVGHSSEEEQKTIPDTSIDHVLHVPEGITQLYSALDMLMEVIKDEKVKSRLIRRVA